METLVSAGGSGLGRTCDRACAGDCDRDGHWSCDWDCGSAFGMDAS
ncbi:hypothetical protein [Streptomyces sp. BK79]